MSSPLATGSTAPSEMSSDDSYLVTLRWVRSQIGRLTGMCGDNRYLHRELAQITRELDRVLDGARCK